MVSRQQYGYGAPPTQPTYQPPTSQQPRMQASRDARANYVPPPPEPEYPLANGQPAAASVPDIAALYGQLLTAVRQQPLPANLSQYSSESAYQRALQQMQAGYANLEAQQAQLRGMLDPSQWAEQEAALLAAANRVNPSRTVLLYGMQ
jgi:hypothetical protein